MSIFEEKLNFTIRELKEWIEAPNRERDDYLNVVSNINEISSGETIQKSVFRQFEYLDTWYSNNFVYEMLTGNKSSYQYEMVSNGYNVLIISDLLSDKFPNNPPYIQFDKIAYFLSNCVIYQWKSESRLLIDIINKGLKTKFLKGGMDIKIAAWFIIELVDKMFNLKTNYSAYNYPKNTVYKEALDKWQTEDLNLLDEIISFLCDFHLKEASYGDISEKAGKKDPMFLQFSTTRWFFYAFEILTWLKIRELTGLKNPATFRHPLMNLSLNKLPQNTKKYKIDKTVEKIINGIK